MDDKPIKILLIEDNPGDVRLIREMLTDVTDFPHHLECADQLATGLVLLAKGNISAVLLDLSLPDSQGLDSLAKVSVQAPDVPIIMLTGLDDERVAMKAVEKGAQDYLVKGRVVGSLIVRSIRYALSRKKAEEELKKYRSHLEELVKERTAQLTSANKKLQREIIRRKGMEEALRVEQQRLFSLLDGLPASIYLQLPDYSIRFANRCFRERFGKPEDKFCYQIICKNKAPCEECPTFRVFETKKPQHYEWVYPGGKTYEMYDYPFTDIDGSPLVLKMSIDITQRKSMEKELQKTQQLESLGILAGGIAHDFNNILVSIVGSLSLLKRHTKSENNFLKILNKAEKAAYLAKNLTQQLLTFSKGGAPIKKSASISELLKDTAGFALRGSRVSCHFSLPAGLWPVEIDEGQISQVINNLIINADQAMRKGGEIRIYADNVTVGADKSCLPLKDGKYVKISVKDQGGGIQEEHLSKVFDPFFSTKQKGSGLGLAISYSIIKKHEGYITVDSKVGEGTTFHIYLPASEKEIFLVENVKEEGGLSGIGKILFMDDQQNVREIVGDMLIDLGYEVGFAKEGNEAVEIYEKAKASEKPFDALILDLSVPGGLGGDEIIRKLLKIDPQVKAIVSSGYSNDPIMSNYKQYGFSGAIAKPYGIKGLGEILYKVINISSL